MSTNQNPTKSVDVQQNIIDKSNEHRRRVANNIQNQIFDGLVTKYEREKNVLPEHIFVRDFLPYFCGELKIDDNEQIIPTWCAISGNPNNEVTILSANGEKLFDVPAIQDPHVFNPAYNHARNNRNMSIDDIGNQAELLSQSMPERGSLFFAEAFEHRAKMLRSKNFDNSEYSQRWLAIFERYGKIQKTQEAASQEGKPVVKTVLSDDDLEF